MISKTDIKLIDEKGISLSDAMAQIERFKTGVAPLNVVAAATVGMGIQCIDKPVALVNLWDNALKEDLKVMKFVPASGAASRMFQDLFAFMNKTEPYPERETVKTFFKKVEDMAFYDDLSDYLEDLDINSDYYFQRMASRILDKSGLGYGILPKGLIKFHKYEDGSRTPFEEHLVEGVNYAATANGTVNIHFTVSAEHKVLFEKLQKKVQPAYEKKYGVHFNLSYSVQKRSTDTIAVDLNNEPFRENGEILFRPGGHGSLIENLNELDGDIIFIKNIDNVVPDHLKEPTITYKKVIAGKLIELQKAIFSFMKGINEADEKVLAQIENFLKEEFAMQLPEGFSEKNFNERKSYLESKLNRPIRVCGMVKNEGEPGGGPFLVKSGDGSVSLQIVEMSQIDLENPQIKEMVEKATHFNPVDLVCSVVDYQGNKFDLTKFVDPDTGFISKKSRNGKDLKALEHPGLWNGAMADWNTVFVEVPIETFNPVKTVNDLIRPQHQGVR